MSDARKTRIGTFAMMALSLFEVALVVIWQIAPGFLIFGLAGFAWAVSLYKQDRDLRKDGF